MFPKLINKHNFKTIIQYENIFWINNRKLCPLQAMDMGSYVNNVEFSRRGRGGGISASAQGLSSSQKNESAPWFT